MSELASDRTTAQHDQTLRKSRQVPERVGGKTLRGGKAGDVAETHWLDPSGKTYSDGYVGGKWNPLPKDGDYFINVKRPTERRGTSRYRMTITIKP